MSLYQTQKLLFDLHNNLNLRDEYKSSSKDVLERYDLDPSEARALLELDVGVLYHMGVHTYLLWNFANMMGVDREAYFKQVRGV